MQLLDKKEIEKKISIDKKMDIDEGMKLAKKIDTLREVSAREEENLSRFRISSLKILKTEVRDLTNQRDDMLEEIKELAKKKQALQVPLDDKWKLVKDIEREIIHKKETIDDTEKRMIERNIKSGEILSEALLEKQRADDDREEARRFLSEANNALEQAKEELAKIAKGGEMFDIAFKAQNLELSKREEVIATTEKTLDIERKQIEKEKVEIANEKIRLEDQRKTLERAFNRITKK